MVARRGSGGRGRRKRTGAPSRAERNIAWIEKYCRVPEGKNVGQPVVLREWQRDEIRRIYDNPHGTRRAILSFGRKNGKTALCAFLLLLHLVGPEAVRNGQLYSAAQSRDQAAILYNLAAKVVRQNPALSRVVHLRDATKEATCPQLGTFYKALSAEASNHYGLSPVFIIHDELGQVRGPRYELYDALETATGAQENPLSVVISTQAPNPTDLLSILIADAKTGADPRTVCSLYTAPPEDERSDANPDGCDPFSEEHVRKANPALGDFQNRDEVMAMAEAARRMPSAEAEFRNLVLNQEVEMFAPYISRGVWEGCTLPGGEWREPDGAPVTIGLDLSEVSDLTAKVAIYQTGGVWYIKPTFWLPADGLVDKANRDRRPYDVWRDHGKLDTTPGRTVDYAFVARTVWDDCQRWNVVRIVFDRWQFGHLKTHLIAAGFTEDQFDGDAPLFQPFGQGFASMSPALRTLEADALEQRLAHGGHPVLGMCAANAVVTRDPAGNRKLDKAKSTGRIDGMVALAMARGAAETYTATGDGPSYLNDAELMVL